MFPYPTPAIIKSAVAILKPQDVFATSLWTDNGSPQAITNGIDLAGKGGLVWTKSRNQTFFNRLSDTLRGANKELFSNTTDAEQANGVTAFGSTGFTSPPSQSSGTTSVSWAWARAQKFFDVVSWTGDGVSGRQIPHNLAIAPGMVIVKSRSQPYAWPVYHRSLANPATDIVVLSNTNAASSPTEVVKAVSATTITLGSQASVNENGTTYVAYLFAHDPSADGIVQCGSYVGNADGTQPFVNLGWRPQFVILKRSSGAANWLILDVQRGWNSSAANFLQANTSGAETSLSGDYGGFASSGFQDGGAAGGFYGSNNTTTIYLAIRAPY